MPRIERTPSNREIRSLIFDLSIVFANAKSSLYSVVFVIGLVYDTGTMVHEYSSRL